MTDGADRAEPDAFAAAPAPFADAREAQAPRTERVTDVVAPHVPAGAERVVAKRVVTPPRRRGGAGIAAGPGIDDPDHPEVRSIAQRRHSGDVRIGIVRGPSHTVAIPRRLGVGVPHRP